MSEMELHVMRNRLDHGRLNKAQRGELFFSAPLGYVRLPTGKVDLDPDDATVEADDRGRQDGGQHRPTLAAEAHPGLRWRLPASSLRLSATSPAGE